MGGRLDRIEFLAGNRVHVIDYKTGKPDKVTVKNLMSQNKDTPDYPWSPYYRQLVFYKLLIQAEGKYEFDSASLLFIDKQNTDKIYTVNSSVPDLDCETLREIIKRITDEINNLTFWDKPYNEEECRYNEYIKILKEKTNTNNK